MPPLRFRCVTCGQTHDGLPDVAFDSPFHYHSLTEEQRRTRARLSSDLCDIDHQDFFVRACLGIPIKGLEEEFVWGVWVSLSETNFRRYVEVFEEDPPPAGDGPWFGWLCNRLPGYPETLSLKTSVALQPRRQRPRVTLEPTEHPLAVHQREGIALDDLLTIVGPQLHAP